MICSDLLLHLRSFLIVFFWLKSRHNVSDLLFYPSCFSNFVNLRNCLFSGAVVCRQNEEIPNVSDLLLYLSCFCLRCQFVCFLGLFSVFHRCCFVCFCSSSIMDMVAWSAVYLFFVINDLGSVCGFITLIILLILELVWPRLFGAIR